MFNQYGNPYGYQQIQQQLPQFAPQSQPPIYQKGLQGRTVQSLMDVTPSDVAMDGGTSWFPAADGSAVWAKAWTPDGTIRTTVYAPVTPEPAPVQGEAASPVLDAILERLTAIEAAVVTKGKKRKEADEPAD